MNQHAEPNNTGNLESILSAHSGGSFIKRWRIPIAIGLIVLVVAGYFLLSGNGENNTYRYLTEKAEYGTLIVKVTATGNLEPTNQVEVGSELSGTLENVLVDDDDQVTRGQVLAELDQSKFEDAVAMARAVLEVSQAGLKQEQATVSEARAKLKRYQEVSRLSGGTVPSKTEMEAAEAELARAEADVASAKASITEAKAALRTDETNLYKAKIRSPIDGVVLERAVDPGQAVAASLQAVTLFTLAEDLSKMELKVDVDEADVGQVQAGQEAIFSVDAWPNRQFKAVITRVGFNAMDDDGVISYPAVLQVDNGDLILRPGMTGTAEITTITHENVLLVPNAALRFSPPQQAESKKSSGSVLSSLMPRPPRAMQKTKAPAANQNGNQNVWVLKNQQITPIEVRAGPSNGRVTEIMGGDLKAGMEVVTEALSNQP
jgi:HlyD family secretion protein